MILFKGQNMLELIERFKTDGICKEYLAEIKWKDGFECRKCHHKASQIRKNFSRTCNICSHTHSATMHTLFHGVSFGIRKAFFICIEMSTSTKELSVNYISFCYGISKLTAKSFMDKVREVMKLSSYNPIDWRIQVDELFVGTYNRKKNKLVYAVFLAEEGELNNVVH